MSYTKDNFLIMTLIMLLNVGKLFGKVSNRTFLSRRPYDKLFTMLLWIKIKIFGFFFLWKVFTVWFNHQSEDTVWKFQLLKYSASKSSPVKYMPYIQIVLTRNKLCIISWCVIKCNLYEVYFYLTYIFAVFFLKYNDVNFESVYEHTVDQLCCRTIHILQKIRFISLLLYKILFLFK